MNWRGRTLTSHEVVVKLIGATTTRSGLRVRAELDRGSYPLGVKVSDRSWPQCRCAAMTGTGVELHRAPHCPIAAQPIDLVARTLIG
jgi:hypothetical protein